MSSSSSSQYNQTLTGSQLGDLELLANLDDKTFTAMCSSSKHFNNLCTGNTKNRLYQMRVQKHMSDYIDLLLPYTDPKDPGRWKKIYDAVRDMHNTDLNFLNEDLSNVETTYNYWRKIAKAYFHDEKLLQLIILDAAYNKLHPNGPKLSFTIVSDDSYQIILKVIENGAQKVLEWLDSLGLLELALTETPSRVHTLAYMALLGDLPMLKYAYAKGIPLDIRYDENDTEGNIADMAVSSGKIEILDWLASKGFLPGQRGLDGALHRIRNFSGEFGIDGHKLNLVQDWMRGKGIRFNPVVMSYV